MTSCWRSSSRTGGKCFPLISLLSQTPGTRAAGGRVCGGRAGPSGILPSLSFPKSRRKVCPESGRGNRWLQLCLQRDGSLANSSFLHFNHVFSMPWRKLSKTCLPPPQAARRAPCLLPGQGVREGHQARTPSHLIPEIQGGTTKPTPSAPRIPSLGSKACSHLSSTTRLPDPDCPPSLTRGSQSSTERLCDYSRCRLESQHCWNVCSCVWILLWG